MRGCIYHPETLRYPGFMSSAKFTPGPTGQTVAANVQRLRKAQGLSISGLARRLPESKMTATSLTRLEEGRRRVDVDDLMSLASALNVLPVTLLLPTWEGDFEAAKELDEATVTGFGSNHLGAFWLWALAWEDLRTSRSNTTFWREVLPPAVAETFELREENKRLGDSLNQKNKELVSDYKDLLSGYEELLGEQTKTIDTLREQLDNITALYGHMRSALEASPALEDETDDAQG